MMDEPYWYSASQVETFALCPRKWAFGYVSGLKSPPKPSQALGLAVHEQLEHWLRDGSPLDLTVPAGEIAMSGIHLLPAPKTPGMTVEEKFTIRIGDHHFRGYKDLEILSQALVGDHKTTSNFKWAKSAQDLETDVQAVLYATDLMHKSGATVVTLQWTYFKTTGGRKAQAVTYHMGRHTVEPTLERILGLCDEMDAIRASGAGPMDLPPVVSACGAFGGCDYSELCGLGIAERVESYMSNAENINEFTAMLQNRNGSAINPPPLPSSEPPTPILVNGKWVLPEEPVAAPAPVEAQDTTLRRNAYPIGEKPKRKKAEQIPLFDAPRKPSESVTPEMMQEALSAPLEEDESIVDRLKATRGIGLPQTPVAQAKHVALEEDMELENPCFTPADLHPAGAPRKGPGLAAMRFPGFSAQEIAETEPEPDDFRREVVVTLFTQLSQVCLTVAELARRAAR